MIMTDQGEGILQIFEQAQESTSMHEMLCKRLTAYYYKCESFTIFAEDFFELCKYSLLSAERIPTRERTVDFIVKFVIHSYNVGMVSADHPKLIRKLLLFCIKYSVCINYEGRFRSMQILRKLLIQLPSEFYLPENLYLRIKEILTQRIIDIKAPVRSQAVLAIARFQNPENPDCEVVRQITLRCAHDSNTEVRKNALTAMVVTQSTLNNLIERCQDLADAVRKTAFNILRDKGIFRPLRLATRVQLIKDGLNDKSKSVQKAARQLLIVWYNICERSPIALLRRLNCETESEVCKQVLKVLFDNLVRPTTGNGVNKFLSTWQEQDKKAEADNPTNRRKFFIHREFYTMVCKWAEHSLDDQKILKKNLELPVENALFWTFLCEYLVKNVDQSPVEEVAKLESEKDKHKASEADSDVDSNSDNNSQDERDDHTTQKFNLKIFEELQEQVIPNMVHLIDYISSYLDMLHSLKQHEKMDEELLINYESRIEFGTNMLVSMDATDDYSRKKLEGLLIRWITTIPSFGMEKSCVEIMKFLYNQPKIRIDKMVHLVNEMLENAFDGLKTSEEKKTKTEEDQNKSETKEREAIDSTILRTRESLSQLSFVVMELKAQNENNEEPRQLTNAEIRNLRIKVAELDVRLTELDDDLRTAIDQRDFIRAVPIQETINEAKREREKLQLCVKTGFDRPLLEQEDLTLIEESNNQALENLSQQIGQLQMSQCTNSSKMVKDMEVVDVDEGVKLEILDEMEAFERLKRISAQVVERGNMLLFELLNSFTEPYTLPSSLRMMLNSLVLPSIRLNAPMIRYYAIRVLGIVSVMDLNFSMRFLCYMFTALRDCPANAEIAISAIGDVLLVHGLELFTKESIFKLTGNPSDTEDSDQAEKNEEMNSEKAICEIQFNFKSPVSDQEKQIMLKRATHLLHPIIKMLDSNDNKCKTRAGVCLSKLLFCDVIKSTELFSKLLISWFNPDLNDLLELRCFVTKFISEYALSGLDQQWVITDSVPIILKTLVMAIPSSPLTKISMNNVISLLVKLTDNSLLERKSEEKRLYDLVVNQRNLQDKVNVEERDIFRESQEDTTEEGGREKNLTPQLENVCHDALALKACQEIIDSPNSGLAQQYVQLVSQLRVSRKKVEETKKLYLLAIKIEKNLDRVNKFIFCRFMKSLTEILKENNLTAEQVKQEANIKNISMVEDPDIDEDECKDETKLLDISQDNSNSTFGSEVIGMNLHLANSPEAIGRKSVALSRHQKTVTALNNTTFLRPAAHNALLDDTQLSCNSQESNPNSEKMILKPEKEEDSSSDEAAKEEQPRTRSSRRLMTPEPKISEPKRQKVEKVKVSSPVNLRRSSRQSLAKNRSLSSLYELETPKRSSRKISRNN